MKRTKKPVSVVLALLLMLCLLPARIAAADGNGTEANPYLFTGETTELVDGGYYLVNRDVTVSTRIEVQGTAVLILGEGATLTASKGVHIGSDKTLTIRGTGTLIARADSNQAAIGGNNVEWSGKIVIEGGTIQATGGSSAAGIGGGTFAGGHEIVITGGNVTATGGLNSAGIGGGANNNWAGRYGNTGTITITGGTVNASGNGPAAGIGGGGATSSFSTVYAGNAEAIVITGGNVTATSDAGYGIGGGKNTGVSSNSGTANSITLGWTNPADSITASGYNGTAVIVVEGQTLTDGENEYSGTLSDAQLSAAAGKTLVPGTLGDGFYLIGPDWSVGAINPANQFTQNPANTSEYVLETTLHIDDKIKVVKVASGAITTWYPDGLGTEYTVDTVHAGNKTIYFKETYQNDWSAFGGYFWINANEGHSVTVANNIENGTVVSDKAAAYMGETVTLTVTPRSGYRLATLTVLCGGTAVATTAGSNGSYTFTMPDGDVSVSAVFEWSTASSDHTIFTEYVFEDGTGGYFGEEMPKNLIDGDINTKWCSNLGSGLTITFHTNLPILPIGYILTTANDSADNSGARNPVDWTIEGRLNETDEWTTLVAVTGDSTLPAANFADREFVLSTSKTCQYFRVTFSKVKSDSIFQLSEFKFFGEYDAVVRITQCAPTCVSMGYARDCWYSYGEDAYYEDEACTRPLNREDVEIPATGIHTLEEHPEVAPVGNTPGNIHFWQCIVCHKFFDDGNAEHEITEDETIVYGPIDYLDENGNLTHTTGAFSVVSSDVMEWTAGWWIVPETMTVEGRINVKGDVHLILLDNTTLTVTNGIGVNQSANSLTIYSQSLGEHMGALTAGPVQNYHAGIGGTKGGNSSYNAGNGPITINGGKIYAKGGWGAAGIGGGHNGAGFGLITINNGDIDAWGGDVGPGIGVGYGPSWYLERAKIVINGGTVVAHAGSHSAAIGGGEDANAEYITINGGNITAYGGEGSAAIGGGYVLNSNHGHGGDITINGGTVNAIAGANGAGIGDATNLKDHSLTTNIVLNWTSETDSITSTSYTYDTLTFKKDFMIQGSSPAELALETNIAGKTIVPYEGKNVTVTFVYEQGGTDVFYEVTTVEGGAVQDPGTPMKLDSLFDGWYYLNGGNVVPFVCGTTAVSENTTVFAQWTSTAGQTVTYLDAEGSACSIDSGYTVLNAGIPAVTLTAGWYVAAHDVTFGERITVSGDVHLIVANDVTMTAQGGIQVGEGNSLTIYQNAGQAEGEAVGKLDCSATAYAAGIGGNGSDVKNSGVITINGCTINSSGGNYAAGIGGGNQGAGTVVINRGTVNAYGSSYASAIGGGHKGAGNVTINDGSVVARTFRGAAIGGGSEGFGTVVINGGVIDAAADTSPGIGSGELAGTNVTINGGTVTAVGDYWAAGIGTSYNHKDVTVDITINGGTVTATGGRFGAGIGGGATTNVSSITITGGVVVANGGQYAAAIGGGGADLDQGQTGERGNCGTLVITGGQVTANAGQYGVGIGNGGTCTTSGTITLGWTDKTDFIKATNYKGPVSVVDGKVLTDGTNDYYGTLTDEQKSAAAGKTLTPGMDSLNSVTIDDGIEHGTVTTDKKYAKEGDTVTLTVTPAEGYLLKSLSVMSGETEVATTGENGVYTFTMPDGDVTVTAEFEPDWDHIPDPSFTLSPAEVTLENFDADGYMALSIFTDALTLGKISEYDAYYLANMVGVKYYAGTLSCGDETIPFKVYSNAHAGTGESHVCLYNHQGQSGEIAIYIDPAVLAHAKAGVYTGTLHYTSEWVSNDAPDFQAEGASGDIALTMTVIVTYSVNVDPNIANGTVIPSKTRAEAGETVTLQISPADGYVLETLTVVDGENNPIEVGTDRTFVMPESDVTVSATFLKYYGVYVGSTQINERNASDVLGDGKVTYDPETYTLTFKEANPPVTGTTDGALILSLEPKLIINAPKGLNLSSDTAFSGIYVASGPLTVNGNLNVTVKGTSEYYGYGVIGVRGVTINGNVNVESASYGIYAPSSDGRVTISGNAVVDAKKLAIFGLNGVEIGGTANVRSETDNALQSPNGPISVAGDAVIDGKGNTVSATSSLSAVTFGGSAVIKNAGENGILCPNAAVTVANDLTVTGSSSSWAIQANQGLEVGGNLTIRNMNTNGAFSSNGSIRIVGNADVTVANGYGLMITSSGEVNVAGNANVTILNGGGGMLFSPSSGKVVVGGNATLIGDATYYSVYGAGGIEIGGNVTIENGYSGGYGLFSSSGPITVGGNADVTSSGVCISMVCSQEIKINGSATLTTTGNPSGHLFAPASGRITVAKNVVCIGNSSYTVYGSKGVTIGGNVSFDNETGVGVFSDSGDIEITGDVDGASYGPAIEAGSGDVILHGIVNVTATKPDAFGVHAGGTIFAEYLWDVTAPIALCGHAGITLTDNLFVELPENGEVKAVELSVYGQSVEAWTVTAPESDEPSDHVKLGSTAQRIECTVEWDPADVKFKGTTPYVVANGKAQTPRFTVKNKEDGSVIDPQYYDFTYRENTNAGTGYVFITLKGLYKGTCRASFKIYLPATTTTTVANVKNGIKISWAAVEGAAGYVIYRRAWSSTTDGWTTFERWNNTTGLTWTDTTVYAGTRYQYGVKAYFERRLDPVVNAYIGGNVGDNFNLGEVGPLKTTVRITTRVLNSVTAGTKQMTVKWAGSSVFTGYQIQYAQNSAFTKSVKSFKIANPKTVKTIIKSLKTGTTYYVRIRSYHEFNGMTYFGEWSNVKSCKVK